MGDRWGVIKLGLPLVGLALHQVKPLMDRHPTIFAAGWREISSYVIGSLAVAYLAPLLMHGTREQRREMRRAHLETLTLLGGGVALGWMIDGIRSRN